MHACSCSLMLLFRAASVVRRAEKISMAGEIGSVMGTLEHDAILLAFDLTQV